MVSLRLRERVDRSGDEVSSASYNVTIIDFVVAGIGQHGDALDMAVKRGSGELSVRSQYGAPVAQNAIERRFQTLNPSSILC